MHVHSLEWISEHLCLALDGPSRSRKRTIWLTLGALRQQGLNAAVPPTTYFGPLGLRSSRSVQLGFGHRLRSGRGGTPPHLIRLFLHCDACCNRLTRQPRFAIFLLIYRSCILSRDSFIANRDKNGRAAVLSWPSIDSAESHCRQSLPATANPPP